MGNQLTRCCWEEVVGHANLAMPASPESLDEGGTRLSRAASRGHYTHVGELAASQAVAALPALSFAEGPAFIEFDAKAPKEIPVESESASASPAVDTVAELRKMNSKNWKKVRDSLVMELKANS